MSHVVTLRVQIWFGQAIKATRILGTTFAHLEKQCGINFCSLLLPRQLERSRQLLFKLRVVQHWRNVALGNKVLPLSLLQSVHHQAAPDHTALTPNGYMQWFDTFVYQLLFWEWIRHTRVTVAFSSRQKDQKQLRALQSDLFVMSATHQQRVSWLQDIASFFLRAHAPYLWQDWFPWRYLHLRKHKNFRVISGVRCPSKCIDCWGLFDLMVWNTRYISLKISQAKCHWTSVNRASLFPFANCCILYSFWRTMVAYVGLMPMICPAHSKLVNCAHKQCVNASSTPGVALPFGPRLKCFLLQSHPWKLKIAGDQSTSRD